MLQQLCDVGVIFSALPIVWKLICLSFLGGWALVQTEFFPYQWFSNLYTGENCLVSFVQMQILGPLA